MIDNAKTKSVIVANIMIGVLDPSKEFTSDLVQEVGERSYDAALKKAVIEFSKHEEHENECAFAVEGSRDSCIDIIEYSLRGAVE